MNIKLEDLMASFKAQIEARTHTSWVSQNDIDAMTEFIFDAEEADYLEAKDKVRYDVEARKAVRTKHYETEREIQKRIADIVSDKCNRLNAETRKQ